MLEDELSLLREKMKCVMEQNDNYVTEIQQLSSKIGSDEMQSKIAELEESNAHYERELINLRAQIDESQRQITKQSTQLAQQSNQYENSAKMLEDELKILRENMKCVMEQNDNYVTEIQQLNSKIGSQAESENSYAKSIRELESNVKSLQIELEQSEVARNQLQETIIKMEEDFHSKQIAANELLITPYKNEILELKAFEEFLEGRLQLSLVEIERLQLVIIDLENSLNDSNSNRESWEKYAADLSTFADAKDQEASLLRGQLYALESKLLGDGSNTLRDVFSRDGNVADKQSSMLDSIELLQRRISELDRNVVMKDDEISFLKNKVSAFESTKATYSGDTNTLKKRISELEELYDSTSREYLNTKTQYESMKSLQDKYEGEAVTLVTALKEMEILVADKDKKIAILGENMLTLESQYENAQSEISQLLSQRNELENKIHVIRKENMEIKQQIGYMESQISLEKDTFYRQIDELNALKSHLSDEVNELKERLISDIQSLNSAKEKELNELRLKQVSLDDSLNVAMNVIKEKNFEIDELQSELSKRALDLKLLEEESVNLRNEILSSQNRVEELSVGGHDNQSQPNGGGNSPSGGSLQRTIAELRIEVAELRSRTKTASPTDQPVVSAGADVTPIGGYEARKSGWWSLESDGEEHQQQHQHLQGHPPLDMSVGRELGEIRSDSIMSLTEAFPKHSGSDSGTATQTANSALRDILSEDSNVAEQSHLLQHTIELMKEKLTESERMRALVEEEKKVLKAKMADYESRINEMTEIIRTLNEERTVLKSSKELPNGTSIADQKSSNNYDNNNATELLLTEIQRLKDTMKEAQVKHGRERETLLSLLEEQRVMSQAQQKAASLEDTKYLEMECESLKVEVTEHVQREKIIQLKLESMRSIAYSANLQSNIKKYESELPGFHSKPMVEKLLIEISDHFDEIIKRFGEKTEEVSLLQQQLQVLDESVQVNKSLKDTISSLRSDNESMAENLRNERATWSVESEANRSTIKSLEDEILMLHEKLETAKTSVSAYKNEIDGLLSEQSVLMDQLEKKVTTNNYNNNQSEGVDEDKNKSSSQHHTNEEYVKISERFQALQIDYEKIIAENSTYAAEQEKYILENEKLRKDIFNIRTDLEFIEEEHLKLRTEYDLMKEKITTLEESNNKLENLLNAKEETHLQLIHSRNELINIIEQQNKDIISSKDEYQQQLIHKEEEINKLKNRLETLQKQLDQSANSSYTETLIDEIKSLKLEKSEIRTAYNSIVQERSLLLTENEDLRTDLKVLSSRIDALENSEKFHLEEISILKSEIANMDTGTGTGSSTLLNNEDDIKALRAKAKKLQRTVIELTDKLDAAENSLNDSYGTVSNLQHRNAKLQEQLDHALASNGLDNINQPSVEALKQERDNLMAALRQSKESLQTNEKYSEDLFNMKFMLQQKVNELEKAMELLREQEIRSTARADELEEYSAGLRETITSLQMRIRELERAMNNSNNNTTQKPTVSNVSNNNNKEDNNSNVKAMEQKLILLEEENARLILTLEETKKKTATEDVIMKVKSAEELGEDHKNASKEDLERQLATVSGLFIRKH